MMIGVPTTLAAASGSRQMAARSSSGSAAHFRLSNVDVRLGTVQLLCGLAAGWIGVRVIKILRALGSADLAITPYSSEGKLKLTHRNVRIALSAILTVSLPWLAPAAARPQEARLRVTPEIVRMGAFYGGASVRVKGVTGPDEKVVIVVRGGKATEVFSKVGRVGPIWVNTGKVTISGVPSLLLVFSSEPLGACLTRAAIDQYGLDLPAIKKQMRIESKTPDYGRIASEYFLYKTKQGSYHLVNGGIRMNQPDKDGLPYTLEFVLPKSAPPGQYEISVLECRKGEVVHNSVVPIKAVEVGFPALVARLASERPSSYGIVSVVAAVLAGFGIDFIAAWLFKRKIGGH